jgi:FAD/FMN-containing dehydrogenase
MSSHRAAQELKSRFSGQLLTPADEGYDGARAVFNTMIDRRPAFIARCANVEDVIGAVRFAREQDLLVSVKCTGHNVAGFAVCDDGLVIDLS